MNSCRNKRFRKYRYPDFIENLNVRKSDKRNVIYMDFANPGCKSFLFINNSVLVVSCIFVPILVIENPPIVLRRFY